MVEEIGHSRDRWEERTPDSAHSLSWAWEHGNSVDHVTTASAFTDKDGDTPDEVRLYHGVTEDGTEYSMILIRRGDALVTAYPYDGIRDSRVEAYVDTIRRKTVVYE